MPSSGDTSCEYNNCCFVVDLHIQRRPLVVIILLLLLRHNRHTEYYNVIDNKFICSEQVNRSRQIILSICLSFFSTPFYIFTTIFLITFSHTPPSLFLLPFLFRLSLPFPPSHLFLLYVLCRPCLLSLRRLLFLRAFLVCLANLARQ